MTLFRIDPNNPTHGEVAMRAAKYALECGEAVDIVIRPVAKSREQEMKYHALIGEFARGYTYHGQRMKDEYWKRLLIDAFKRDTWNDPEHVDEWRKFGSMQMIPAFGAPGVVAVGEQSRRFSKRLAMAFITWLEALKAECIEGNESPIQPAEPAGDDRWD